MKPLIINNTLILWDKVLKKITTDTTNIFNIIMPFTNEIKEGIFRNNQSIRFIYAPKLKIVGKNAFSSCFCLHTVVSNDLKSIGDRAFCNDTNLSKINLVNVENFDEYALYYTSIMSIVNIECKKLGMNAIN